MKMVDCVKSPNRRKLKGGFFIDYGVTHTHTFNSLMSIFFTLNEKLKCAEIYEMKISIESLSDDPGRD